MNGAMSMPMMPMMPNMMGMQTMMPQSMMAAGMMPMMQNPMMQNPMMQNMMMPNMMSMQSMMPMMMGKMKCTMTATGMTCEMMPMDESSKAMFMEFCKRMTSMMSAGQPMMMNCNGMMMVGC